jgi:uncharacterized protein with von Willebrand factor type A (vWA) domain
MVWARALGAAVVAVALKEKRRCVLTMFSDHALTVIIDLGETRKKDTLEALELLTEGSGGGTDGPGALRHALSFVRPGQPPDVLVVTDAEFGHTVDQMVAETKAAREQGGKVVAVTIASSEPTPWADKNLAIQNLTTQEAVKVMKTFLD